MFPGGGVRFRFGDCVLDGETRQLQVGGKPVHLTPKAFQFLWLLLENRPRALSKDEIHAALWQGTFVSDGTLTSLLAEVRSAIGDTPRSRLIRTVHRYGYAFSGDAERVGPRGGGATEFAYRLLWGSRQIALAEGENVLGRDPAATVLLEDRSVSRRHARITIERGRAEIEDLKSKNGTFVGERPATGPTPLQDGDALRIGTLRLTYRAIPAGDSTQSADRSGASSAPGGSARRAGGTPVSARSARSRRM
jgi:DNA-binding winged helix-turn-helix (wHTH) protein